MDPNVKLHRFRYHLARGFVKPGDVVIDLGCGQGYGSYLLAEVAKKVYAYDIDKTVVPEYEDATYSIEGNTSKVEFHLEDLEEVELPEVDVAVQLENLEHLYNPAEFVKKLKPKVKKFIIVSVPCGAEKLIEVDGDIQADKDSTHHSVFDTPEQLIDLFVDENWKVFKSFRLGVTLICIFYNESIIKVGD